jgi:methionyl-tRNA formyltransferase
MDDINVCLCIIDESDSGQDTWRQSFLKSARELNKNIIITKFPHSKHVLEKIDELKPKPDLLLSLQCTKIIRESIINKFRLGCVNCHNAPLPLLRGCDPFAWAIHDGLKQMGVTLHKVPTSGIDDGPIIAQKRWSIENDTTAWDLYNKGLTICENLLQENLLNILNETIKIIPQDERYVTYHPANGFPYQPLTIDWSQPAATISSLARARIFPPLQVPTLNNGNIKINRIESIPETTKEKPGTVLSLCPFKIAAKWGTLLISELKGDITSLRVGDIVY